MVNNCSIFFSKKIAQNFCFVIDQKSFHRWPLKYLLLTLDIVIIYLLSSFIMNGTWFALTFFNFNGAYLSTKDLWIFEDVS